MSEGLSSEDFAKDPLNPFKDSLTKGGFDEGRIIKKDMGDRYPWWRLSLHLLGPLAKIGFSGRFVCSEIDAKYEYYLSILGPIYIRHGQYKGTNPDTLADEWVHWKNFKIVYEGRLGENNNG